MPRVQMTQAGNTAQTDRTELQPELMSMMREEVGRARDQKMPIIRAFEAVARKTGLKSNTIRNYYYRYLHAQESTGQTMGGNHEGSASTDEIIGKPFTAEEIRELMKNMLQAQAEGESVRGCAQRLSGGDKRVLIRLQNKYRSIIAREPEYVSELIREMRAAGIPCLNPYTRERERTAASYPGEMTEGDEMIGMLSQFAINMKGIGGNVLYDFIKGLRDMSGLAVKGSRRNSNADKRLLEREKELKELHNQLLVLKTRMEKDEEERSRLRSELNSLMHVNRNFVELPDAEKLTSLQSYIEGLQTHMM